MKNHTTLVKFLLPLLLAGLIACDRGKGDQGGAPDSSEAIKAMKTNPKTEKGARFWAYISPSNNTQSNVTSWSITLQQKNGNWTGTMTKEKPILQTPELSGEFTVKVTASGPHIAPKELSPASYSKPDIGCNSNCSCMVGIVSNAEGTDANYWTVWDAVCN